MLDYLDIYVLRVTSTNTSILLIYEKEADDQTEIKTSRIMGTNA